MIKMLKKDKMDRDDFEDFIGGPATLRSNKMNRRKTFTKGENHLSKQLELVLPIEN